VHPTRAKGMCDVIIKRERAFYLKIGAPKTPDLTYVPTVSV